MMPLATGPADSASQFPSDQKGMTDERSQPGFEGLGCCFLASVCFLRHQRIVDTAGMACARRYRPNDAQICRQSEPAEGEHPGGRNHCARGRFLGSHAVHHLEETGRKNCTGGIGILHPGSVAAGSQQGTDFFPDRHQPGVCSCRTPRLFGDDGKSGAGIDGFRGSTLQSWSSVLARSSSTTFSTG